MIGIDSIRDVAEKIVIITVHRLTVYGNAVTILENDIPYPRIGKNVFKSAIRFRRLLCLEDVSGPSSHMTAISSPIVADAPIRSTRYAKSSLVFALLNTSGLLSTYASKFPKH